MKPEPLTGLVPPPRFYKEVLRIDSQLLQTISWDKVVCRLSEAQHQVCSSYPVNLSVPCPAKPISYDPLAVSDLVPVPPTL